MTNIFQIIKTNKQKITNLALSGMLMVSVVLMVSVASPANAAAPSNTWGIGGSGAGSLTNRMRTGANSADISIHFGGSYSINRLFSTSGNCSTGGGTPLAGADLNSRVTLRTATSADASKEVTVSGDVITINPSNDLPDGSVTVTLKSNWYYRTDDSDNSTCRSGSSRSITFTVDTTAPTVKYSVRIIGGTQHNDENGEPVQYLNDPSSSARDGDKIEVTMTFTDEDPLRDMVQPTVQFKNDSADLGSPVIATGTGKIRKATYIVQGTETVNKGNLKYLITNEAALKDAAENELGTPTEQVIDNVVIDTTKPTIASGPIFSVNGETGMVWAKSGDTIDAVITFSEKIDENRTSIRYRVGSGGDRAFGFVDRFGSLAHGKCQSNDAEQKIYTCRYVVPARTNGLFGVRVSVFQDLAGNNGTPQTYNTDASTGVTIDTAFSAPSAITFIPASPSDTAIFKDPGVSYYRGNNQAPSFRVTAQEGLISGTNAGTITLYKDEGCFDQIGSAELTDRSAPYQVSVETDLSEEEDGLKSIYARHTDAAGNTSDCSTVFEQYHLDTTEVEIEKSNIAYYSDFALSNEIDESVKVSKGSDIFTKVVFNEKVKHTVGSSARRSPELSLRIGDGNSLVYSIRNNTSAAGLRSRQCMPNDASNLSDVYICKYTVRPSDSGEFLIEIGGETADLLGHKIAEAYTHTEKVLIDNQAPAKPSNVKLDADDDSGDDDTDGVTNKTTSLTITGCAEADSTIALFNNGNAISGATGTANGSQCTNGDDTNGAEFSIDIDLAEGKHKITARATDGYTNQSPASDALTIAVDTTAPTTLVDRTPTGTYTSATFSSEDVRVSGTDVTHYKYKAVPGTVCTGVSYSTLAEYEVAIDISYTDLQVNKDGPVTLCVIGRDIAGNWQTTATTAQWTIDNAAPAKPTNLDLAAEDDSGASNSDKITKNTANLTITGCAEANSVITLFEGEVSIDGTVIANGATGCTGDLKKFTKDISLTDNRAHQITAEAADALGNSSEKSDALEIRIISSLISGRDIMAKNLDLAAEDDSGENTDNITNQTEDLTITGTLSLAGEQGDYVQLYDGGVEITDATDKTFTGGSNKEWSIDIDLTGEGTHSITAKVLDIAGNEGVVSSPLIITIDTTGPTVSVTQNIASPTNDVTPDIKIRTSAAGEVSFGGECEEDADSNNNPTPQTVVAGENTITLPELGNNSLENPAYECTVMVRDETDNLSDEANIRAFIVDSTPPTIESATVNNAARTETKVTLNERVYAPTTPPVSDFQIEIGDIAYADLVTGISGIAKTKTTASQSFIITHSELPTTGNIAIKYVKGTSHIFDQIGNTLESTTQGTAISATRFARVTLHADDDTGFDKTDGLTRFDGDTVTLTISLNTDDSFTNGDRVRVFMGSSSTAVAAYTISNTIRGSQYIDADGERSFDIEVPKTRFNRGVNKVSATYARATGIEGSRGAETSITYDNIIPIARVQNPNTNLAVQKEVSATDNETNATVWKYKVLTESVQVCNAAAMESETTEYTEGEVITFESTDDNGSRVCFSTTDTAGNTAYISSNQLSGIDTTEPTVESVSITSTAGTTTKVSFSEAVYAATSINPNDFRIVSGNAQYIVTEITELANSKGTAKVSLVLTHVPLGDAEAVSLRYTKGNTSITDVAGNTLQSFTETIESKSFVTLALDPQDDTGARTDDGITQFDGDEVSLTASLTSGTFRHGDQIQIYERGKASSLKRVIVASAGTNTVDASGATSFTTTVAKRLFTEGTILLYAAYTPVDQATATNGVDLSLTYDATAPTIRITEANTRVSAQKTISATGGGASETEWKYAQIKGDIDCDADALQTSEKYTEGKTISLNSENDNSTKICFSVTDLAGNTAYKSSQIITSIDTEAPTIASLAITGEDEITVVMSEPVYAVRNPDLDDFVVFVNNTHVNTAAITGIERTADRAKNEFTIIIDDTVRGDDTVALSYIGSSRSDDDELVKDVVGNTLATFDKIAATLPSIVTIKLDPADDTGTNTTDGITRFGDDSEVNFVVTLSRGTFRAGDRVRIYKSNENRAVASITVGIRNNEVNARGETTLTAKVAKRQFSEGTFELYATYQPRLDREGLPSALLSITYDMTAPSISITNPDINPAQSKDIKAVDEEDAVETSWEYKQIAGDTQCNATQMASDTDTYTEGEKITFSKESDNNTKVCFSSTDAVGNTSYEVSEVLSGIDTTAPSITVNNPNTDSGTRKTVSAEDADVTGTVWGYIQINEDESCGGPRQVREYIEGTDLVLDKEADNNTKICFFVSDLANNIARQESTVITGIDQTPSTITVTNPTDSPEQKKAVSATDSDEKVTTWHYKQIAGSTSCDTAQMSSEAKAYTEGTEINLSDEDDNGTKICFSVTDAVGNTSYEVSETIIGIDTTPPTIAITNATTKVTKEKVIQAADAETEETVWTYKQVSSSAKCDATQMISGTESYTEGEKITFSKESDNGTKICFSATDQAGNISYGKSSTLKNIDITAPKITVSNPDVSVVSNNKKISAVDNEEDSQWTYQQISEDVVCDASAITTATEYIEGTELIFDKESDNGTKVCFAITDTAGNVVTQASIALMNIKESASAITITTNTWIDPATAEDETIVRAQAKAVVGTDGNETETTWFYKQIAGDAICNAAMRNADDIKSYTEGESIILRKESDNGTKICFISVDGDGKVTAAASEIITGIDVTVPVIIITNPTTDPAQEKTVVAFDRDSSETSWQYRQIAANVACDSDALVSGQEYAENTPLTFTKESDNNTKVCFSVTDTADNTSYAASDVLTGIDATAPVISSAKLMDVRQTQTKITVSKYVFTEGTVSPSDFKIEIEGVPYPATGVSGFERLTETQETTFVITHPAIVSGKSATLSYTKGSTEITDAVGNVLEDFSGYPLSDKAFVALSLDESDDTGLSATDGITKFTGNEVTVIAAISEGSFSNGDVVHLYKKGTARALKRVLISGGLVNAVSAHGESALEIVIPKSVFAANEETTLYAIYTPADGSNDSGQRGLEFTVSYRTTVPQVTVTTSAVSAATATVRAIDESKEGETVWQYKQIQSDEECIADTFAQEVGEYTEGTEISFTDETANDTKACFSSTDIAGNASYATSEVIAIDLTAPSITVKPLTNKAEKAKIVRATDNDEGKTLWRYRVVKADQACDADTMSGKTRSYKEGSGLKFSSERANGHKVCFSSTDTSGNILYAESMTMRGIDRTAPNITVTTEGDQEKVIRARDTDTAGGTSWKYRVVKANEGCAAETVAEISRVYREGSGLVFRNSRANGYKVCFAATDSAGNVSYRTSDTMQGIGKTTIQSPSINALPSSRALQDANLPKNTASPLASLSNPLYPITR